MISPKWLATAARWGALLGAASCAGASPRVDPGVFAFDGAKSIIDEEHLGIVGGRLSAGIAHSDVMGVRGLWAPPFVSSDLRLDLRIGGEAVRTERWSWLPYCVTRQGTAQGIEVRTETAALPGTRTVLIEVRLRNRSHVRADLPLAVTVGGTADRSGEWGFSRPLSSTRCAGREVDGALELAAGGAAVSARVAGWRGRWDAGTGAWSSHLTLAAGRHERFYVVVALGEPSAATTECRDAAREPGARLAGARRAWAARTAGLFGALPRLEASDRRLVAFYNRSLVHFLTNRWDVPEFVLQPYYSTGSVKGGCVCNYLWNYGEAWELFPLADPAAARSHILQFLRCDISTHFAFDPLTGGAFGPWYPVNQEKILGSIFYYVMHTGDAGLLKETVNGRSVLEWVMHHATVRDDPGRPVALIDYGPSNSHLELRRQYGYNHVMPDLNGRRYASYLWAHRLAEIGGRPAPWLAERAAALRGVMRRELWDAAARWFPFVQPDGRRELRWTMQMFKVIGSGVLDVEEEAGLLSHLNEREFLSADGFHSLSKLDPAYDPADVDNGGPGACTSFAPQIIEKLYRSGRPAEAAGILQRILWWGDRMPYWGDSIVAERVDYRRDTPLQCTFDGVAGAQCIIFGMFGVSVTAEGAIRVDPRPPAYAPRIALRGLRLRGRVVDIVVAGGSYCVRTGVRTLRAAVGTPIVIAGGG